MPESLFSVCRYLAVRYVSVGRSSHLVSFMSALAVFGLSLSVAILVLVLSVMNGFDREMRHTILGIVPHITLYTEENLLQSDWDAVTDQLASLPDLVSIAPVVQAMGIVSGGGGNKGVLINGIDRDAGRAYAALDNFFVSGSLPDLYANRWGVAIGESLAESIGVETGDQLTLYSSALSINPLVPLANFRKLDVVGTFRVGTKELDGAYVMINQDAARALFRLRSPQNALHLRLDDALAADRIAMELDALVPATFFIESWTLKLGSIYDNIRFSRNIVAFMLWLLVSVAAFNLVVSLMMIVRDKRGDIAILRTLGASPKTVTRIFLWQGCLIGLIGTAFGLFFGILGATYVTEFARWLESSFSLQLLSADVYPIDYLPSELQALDLAVVVIVVFFLVFCATIIPARRAARIHPAEALRQE